jgi:hypothetical protein
MKCDAIWGRRCSTDDLGQGYCRPQELRGWHWNEGRELHRQKDCLGRDFNPFVYGCPFDLFFVGDPNGNIFTPLLSNHRATLADVGF